MRAIILSCFFALALAAAEEAERAESLAAAMAEAVGIDDWHELDELRFTWTHHPSGTTRRYVWDRADGQVTMHEGDASITINAAGPGEDANDRLRQAHKHFVNDSYWLLFPFMVQRDAVTLSYRGHSAVPGLPDLGTAEVLAVQYPEEGGYTPGDRYVLYLGEDHRPLAWAYHPGGSQQAKILTTRGERQAVAGMHLPTRFVLADGSVFISIDELSAE